MTTYYTSDLHFGHNNICKYTNRILVTSQENHDEWLIDLWNNQVAKGDLVYVLGDLSFGKFDFTKKILSRLNGQIIVIKGNHDRREDLNKLVELNLIQSWHDYKEVKVVGSDGVKHHACMFHFPIACWHKQGYGAYHLFGHSHSSFFGEGLCLDVGIDNAYHVLGEHRLFSADDIVNYMSNKEFVVKDHHADRRGEN